jgi:hypothetical protein
MWPTMLAAASERYPKGGAFAMGVIGTAGSLSIYFVLPKMGAIFDEAAAKAAGSAEAFKAMAPGPALEAIKTTASVASFRFVAILPAILLLVFGAIWLRDRSKGGFKPVKISE